MEYDGKPGARMAPRGIRLNAGGKGLLLFRGGGFGGLDPLAVFALDVVAFVRLGTDLFGAEFADLLDGGAFLLGDGGVNDLAVGVFGREMSCVGFSLGLSLAITALGRQERIPEYKGPDVIIGYEGAIPGTRAAALALAEKLRTEGSTVILDSSHMSEEELDEYAASRQIAATFDINMAEEGEE